MILDINIGSINNARIPDALRARANGAYRFINYGVRPIGAILGGLLGTALGVREALFVSAVAASLGVLWMIGSPVLHLRDLPDAAVEGCGSRTIRHVPGARGPSHSPSHSPTAASGRSRSRSTGDPTIHSTPNDAATADTNSASRTPMAVPSSPPRMAPIGRTP